MPSPVLIVGSVALDSVETAFGKVDRAAGGAGTFSAIAASPLVPVRLVGVIGDDFPAEALALLRERGVDLEGVEVVPGGRSFHWAGRYSQDMNSRETLATELNVFADFAPRLPEAYRGTPYVFLANIQPGLQRSVLDQMESPRFVMCDTMNFWIEGAREELLAVLRRVDLALLNDEEARQLTGETNLAKAAAHVLGLGPKYAVIKRGEHGASLTSAAGHFALPCCPVTDVCDPTGAGDSFAGGLIGFLASVDRDDEPSLRQALACGTVLASACVQGFSLDGLIRLTGEEMRSRYEGLRGMVAFDELPPES